MISQSNAAIVQPQEAPGVQRPADNQYLEFRLLQAYRPADSGPALDFGRPVLQAHGVNPDTYRVINCSDFILDASACQPVVDPRGDIYLGGLGLATSAPGDTILSLRTLPGLLDYYREVGLLAPDTRVIEMDPLLSSERPGFPQTSPLMQLLARPDVLSEVVSPPHDGRQAALVGTFITPDMRQALEQAGVATVQRSNPAETNNKLRFSEASELYGFRVMPHLAIESAEDLGAAAELVRSTIDQRLARGETPGINGWAGVWLKLAGGSGGDFVQKVNISAAAIRLYLRTGNPARVEREARQGLEQACQRIRASVDAAFERNSYGPSAREAFWPDDCFAPLQSSLMVEQDVHAAGRVLENASNMILIDKSGICSVEGSFRQLTGPDGDYRGSIPFNPADSLGAEGTLDHYRQLGGIVAYSHGLGLLGWIGVDFFVIEDEYGERCSIMTEENGRISISGTAKIIADKLGAPAWINVNLQARGPILSIEDFKREFGEAADFRPGDFSECRIVPQAFRTVVSEDERGLSALPSSVFKALIVGPTPAACEAFMQELYQSGNGK